MHEYKLLTQKDSFGGKFDGPAIERTLNEYAGEGWRVVNAFNVPNLKTFGGQIMILLERSQP